MCQRRSVFAPDHEHLHHSLQAAGLSHRGALSVMLALGVAFASVGMVGRNVGVSDGSLVVSWLGANVLYYQLMRRPEKVVEFVRTLHRRVLNPRRAGP